MKIALTGGSGTVGRAIIERALARGDTLVSLDRALPAEPYPGVDYRQLEMSDYDGLVAAFAGCEAMIHMAAIPAPFHHPDHVVHNNNVVGSYNAMRAAIECGIRRICQASSVNAIGLSYSREASFDYFPVDEQHPNHGEEPYALSKWICEAQADNLARRYADLQVSSMRFHWVIGDRALGEQRQARYVYDLGQEWFRETGKPMVWALYLVRRGFGELSVVRQAFAASRQWGLENMDEILRVASKRTGLSPERLENYFGVLDYELDEASLAGLHEFQRRAAALGLPEVVV